MIERWGDLIYGGGRCDATKLPMMVLAAKDGVDVCTIATRYGIPQSTSCYPLDRLASQSISAPEPTAETPHSAARDG